MTLGALRGGDIVLCERRGWRFYALVVARHERELEVEPIDRRVTYHRLKAREVLGIWRKSRAQNGRDAEPGTPQEQVTSALGAGSTNGGERCPAP